MRTPSSTAAELETLIGARGAAEITSANRALAQKWLTSMGVRAVVAKQQTLASLNQAYNDNGDTLETLIASAGGIAMQDPVTLVQASPSAPAAAFGGLPLDVNSAAMALVQALQAQQVQKNPEPAALDETKIRAIALDAVKDFVSRPVQINLASGVNVTLPAGEHRHAIFETVLKSVVCGNVALVGPAGSGKTTLAEQVAKALNVPFYFNGAISSEYKLTGFVDAQGRTVRTAFRDAYEKGGLYLFDEIDGSSPQAVLAFNAALANGYADFPDGMVKRHESFYVMAAANTYWTGQDRVYVGRNQLDGATLDRFIFVDMAYDEKLERQLAGNDDWVDTVQQIRAKVRDLKLRHIVSPRASIMGAKLLAQGLSRSAVLKTTVYKGLDQETINKIGG